jgi:hypothetical protein
VRGRSLLAVQPFFLCCFALLRRPDLKRCGRRGMRKRSKDSHGGEGEARSRREEPWGGSLWFSQWVLGRVVSSKCLKYIHRVSNTLNLYFRCLFGRYSGYVSRFICCQEWIIALWPDACVVWPWTQEVRRRHERQLCLKAREEKGMRLD